MRRSLTLAASVIAVLLPAASADAKAGRTSCQTKVVKTTYSANYHMVRKAYGVRAPGRNIRKWGIETKRAPGFRPSTCRELRKSIQTLKRMREPRPVAVRLQPTAPYVPPAQTATVRMRPATSGGLPSCTWKPESGGDYGAYNPSSGARGKYQVIPSTHAAHCSDLGWSPSDQDRCAARVYAAQGAGAWVNC